MSSLVRRVMATKAAKSVVVAALAAAAVGLVAPISSASNETTWQAGCRGYWYSTSGHGYCYDANTFYSSTWYTDYDCNNEIDKQHADVLGDGYVGKYDTYECTFKLNKTHVHQ